MSDDAALPAAASTPVRTRRDDRQRVGTRLARKLLGSRKDRAAFLDLLARHGDPALAADRLGLPLMLLFRHRDTDPVFAAEWQSAVGYAWEQVETRVLATLLEQLGRDDGTGDGGGQGGGKPAPRGGLVDSRLALAILNGRDRPVTKSGRRPGIVESAGVARLRAEVQALAGRRD